MNASDIALLRRLSAGGRAEASVDELQGLLLQIVFALLMVFIIAYFIFVDTEKKSRAEQLIELDRQKLVLALERQAELRRTRYGLNALLVQEVDGTRTFDADGCFRDGTLSLTPAAARAFGRGSAAAAADFADPARLCEQWTSNVVADAGVDLAQLRPEDRIWIAEKVAADAEAARLDVRGAQRALAARLQRRYAADPTAFAGVEDPQALAEAVRRRSLDDLAQAIGSEVLP